MSAPDLGFGFDRADTADTTPKPIPAGVEGHPVGYRGTVITVPVSSCCGALPGDIDECAAFAAEVTTAPVIVLPPFPLRELRERHITAADLDRGAA